MRIKHDSWRYISWAARVSLKDGNASCIMHSKYIFDTGSFWMDPFNRDEGYTSNATDLQRD